MADFSSGRQVSTKLYIATAPGGQPLPWLVKSKSIRVQEVAVEVADGVCGENRDRLQKITNFYRLTLDVFDDSTAPGASQLIQTWLANQANEDAGLPQLPMAGSMVWRYLDTSAIAVSFSGCTLGPVDYNVAGRTERNMGVIMFRAQYMTVGAAA